MNETTHLITKSLLRLIGSVDKRLKQRKGLLNIDGRVVWIALEKIKDIAESITQLDYQCLDRLGRETLDILIFIPCEIVECKFVNQIGYIFIMVEDDSSIRATTLNCVVQDGSDPQFSCQ